MNSRSTYYKTVKAIYTFDKHEPVPDIHVPDTTPIPTEPTEPTEQEPEPVEEKYTTVIKEKYDNTNPSVWGPPFWFTLHNGALNYPSLANPLYIERMKNFILGIPVMIPCHTCKDHAISFIEYHKDQLDYICASRDKLFKFFVDFHNQVNVRYNKPEMSYNDAYKLYDK
uniref:thiol oxidase n=1 Tax=viral metagenome TaxID=1070528 RepID=A0A6C0E0J0_9ZZZZ